MTRFSNRETMEGFLRDLRMRMELVERKPGVRVDVDKVAYTAIDDITDLSPTTREGTVIYEISTGNTYVMTASGPVLQG